MQNIGTKTEAQKSEENFSNFLWPKLELYVRLLDQWKFKLYLAELKAELEFRYDLVILLWSDTSESWLLEHYVSTA